MSCFIDYILTESHRVIFRLILGFFNPQIARKVSFFLRVREFKSEMLL